MIQVSIQFIPICTAILVLKLMLIVFHVQDDTDSFKNHSVLGFFITRIINDSCTIKGVPFKKGMGVLIPVYALHRDEEFWPEPDCFNPDRFLPENKGSINEFAYLPFGSGPRLFIGMRFALMEIKTILVKMLQQYRFVRVAETPFPLRMQPKGELAPAEAVMIRFEHRGNS